MRGRHRLYSDHRLCAAEGNVRGGPADDPQVSLVESRILEDDMICLRVSYRFICRWHFRG